MAPQVSSYSAWVWSPEHQRHYCYRYVDGQIQYQWSGAAAQAPAAPTPAPPPAATRVDPNTPRTPGTYPPQQAAAAPQLTGRANSGDYTTRQPAARRPAARNEPEEAEQEEEPDESGDEGEDEESDEEDTGEISGGEEALPAAVTSHPRHLSHSAARPVVHASRTTQPPVAHQPAWGRSASYPYGGAQGPTNGAGSGSGVVSSNYGASPYPVNRTSYSATPQTATGETAATVASTPSHRHIRTNTNQTIETNQDRLDPRYKRVSQRHHHHFFIRGRVFKMLWTEPAGVTPGKTRGSTHFSVVRYSETAYSEIRRFIVINNKGQFSQCIPIQTYRGQGARKRGLIVSDHAVIYTGRDGDEPPDLLPDEQITKQAIRVTPTGEEGLEPASRVNFGKVYTVEHNVKVLDIGIVDKSHEHLLVHYYNQALATV